MGIPEITLHPKYSRAELYLPWKGGPSANFKWLKTVCGDSTRPQYDKKKKKFLVARTHTNVVLDALVEEFGRVKVRHFGYQKEACVEQCWNAKPENYLQCECSCAGKNHGSGSPMGKEVSEGLSIQGEYVLHAYVLSLQS